MEIGRMQKQRCRIRDADVKKQDVKERVSERERERMSFCESVSELQLYEGKERKLRRPEIGC